jgi:alkanesulfonate monooxygenase SsuD/methylene tetrahydromethanopterin reductase-like flavin-dependent oxidoreductase (luciferase family)
MTEARIGAIVKAWAWDETASPVDLRTPYDEGVIDGRVTPAPYRQPHPLVGRASRSDQALLDCARRGWPVLLAMVANDITDAGLRQVDLYREALLGGCHPQHVVDECLAWLGPLSLVCVAETEQEAKRRFAEYVELGGVGPIAEGLRTSRWAQEWQKRQDQKASITFCGTPDMVVEHVRTACEKVGSNHIRVFPLDIPGKSEENLDSYQQFLEEVVPRLDPEPLPGPVDTIAAAPPKA